MSTVDKRERLLRLTMALLHTPRPLSAAELRERMPEDYGSIESKEAFRRAFARDKEALREMGVPITLSTVPGTDPPVEGYQIRPADYYLADPGLDEQELAALRLAAEAVRVEGLDADDATEGLLRLGGLVSPGPDLSVAATVAPLPGSHLLTELFDAVQQRCTVQFSYRGGSEIREVDPHRLEFRRGRWYLQGYDHQRDDHRLFRLDRIDGPLDVGPPRGFAPVAEHRDDTARGPWEYGDEPPVHARVRIDPSRAAWARQLLGDRAELLAEPDGALVAVLEVTDRAGFRTFVLGLLEHAEVLEPAELRDDLVAWLEECV